MESASSERLQELLDRQDIVDCLHRYARGLDRLDEALALSAFHEDAHDYHAGVVVGSPRDVYGWFMSLQDDSEATQHFLTNITIDLDGDSAHVESYWFAPIKLRSERDAQLHGGRYIDRFERRNGEWKIATRVVLPEWTVVADGAETAATRARSIGRLDGSDPSYERPLRPRTAVPA
jgi:hypothetical protein